MTGSREYAEGLRAMARFASAKELTKKNPDGSRRFARIGDFPAGVRESLLRNLSMVGNSQLDLDQKVTTESGLDLTLTGADGRRVTLVMTLGDRGTTRLDDYEAQAVPQKPLTREDVNRLVAVSTPGSQMLRLPGYFLMPSVKIECWGAPMADKLNAGRAMRAVTAEISRRIEESERLVAEARADIAGVFAEGDPEAKEIVEAKGKPADALPNAIAAQLDRLANNAKGYGFASPEEFRAFVKGATVSNVSMGLGFMTAVRGPNGLEIFGHEY